VDLLRTPYFAVFEIHHHFRGLQRSIGWIEKYVFSCLTTRIQNPVCTRHCIAQQFEFLIYHVNSCNKYLTIYVIIVYYSIHYNRDILKKMTLIWKCPNFRGYHGVPLNHHPYFHEIFHVSHPAIGAPRSGAPSKSLASRWWPRWT
jgi:hypothetical protein